MRVVHNRSTLNNNCMRMKSEFEKWARVIKDAGLMAN